MSTITFYPAFEGHLPKIGASQLGLLTHLGALLHTAKLNRATCRFELQTDREGLESTRNMAGETVQCIASLMETIGFLSVYAEHNELPDYILHRVGWIQVGLAELLHDVEEVGALATSQLLKPDAQATDKKPETSTMDPAP